ncbi:MAG: 16S rRNA (guanine(966)-N(2))-methyltransferase RsmD [Sulfuritalea sp.]|nr:16S rRNA (guanine(966)-N(2))-methyltransferase RsmD [Sulfuritalea sp.]
MSRIRITGGTWRSRLVHVEDTPGLRPTPDRVRETLFNWLGQDLGGLSCLDLFAGSGILGFEAASRGADYVALVERSRSAFAALKKQAENFGCPRLELFCCDALKFAPQSARRFDLLFLDPPYGQDWLARVEPLLDGLAAPNSRLYAEAEKPLQQLGQWSVVKQGRAGQVFFHLLEQA